jgi:vacuole morphology and inheritance protein 14
MLLESRGSLIVRRLCVLLGAERVFREMAAILMEESNVEFAGAWPRSDLPAIRR